MSLQGDKWTEMRTKLNPFFTPSKLKTLYKYMYECSSDLHAVIEKVEKDKSVIDMQDIMQRFTTDVLGSCVLGIESKSVKDPNAELHVYGTMVFQVDLVQKLRVMSTILWPQILYILKIGLIRKKVRDFFISTVNQIVEYREKNNVDRKDFMHVLMQPNKIEDLKNIESYKQNGVAGSKLTLNEKAAQVFLFWIAGLKTTTATLTFLFYELAANPQAQEKVRKEVFETLEKYNGEITYDAAMEMQYMQRCLDGKLMNMYVIYVVKN